MRWLFIIAASIATSDASNVSAMHRATAQTARDTSPRVVLDHPRARVYRTTAGSLSGSPAPPPSSWAPLSAIRSTRVVRWRCLRWDSWSAPGRR